MGSAPYYAYGAVGLVTDNTASLHKIQSGPLRQNDIAIVVEDSKVFFYRLEINSGESQDIPYVIKPATETGSKRWLLISQETYTTDIIQLINNYIQTSHIKAISDNTIEIEASNGSKIVIDTDGTVTFPSFVNSLSTPTNNAHLTNKLYVDTEFEAKKNELETYVDVTVSGIKDELKDYTDSLFDNKKIELENYSDNYIDTEIDAKEISLKNYIDSGIGAIEDNIKDYVDSEIQRVINDVYPVHKFTIDTWTASDGLYYSDVNHNKGFNEVIIRCWDGLNEMVFPYKIEVIDIHNTRIWMTEEITLTILVV